MNSVSITGNLVRDLELKKTTDNLSVVDFTVASERDYKKDGQPDADFISCRAWRQSADYLCKYGKKGDHIELTGSIRTGSYVDKKGNTVYTTQVYADKVKLIRRDRETLKEEKKEQTSFNDILPEELPFY